MWKKLNLRSRINATFKRDNSQSDSDNEYSTEDNNSFQTTKKTTTQSSKSTISSTSYSSTSNFTSSSSFTVSMSTQMTNQIGYDTEQYLRDLRAKVYIYIYFEIMLYYKNRFNVIVRHGCLTTCRTSKYLDYLYFITGNVFICLKDDLCFSFVSQWRESILIVIIKVRLSNFILCSYKNKFWRPVIFRK